MIYLTNGNMPLNAAYADEIVQEDNSTYQLTFRFPTSDSLWEQLKEETFLTADDLHGEQDFVIFEIEKKHGYIQVYANQVFTLLNNYVVNPISLDRQTGSTALSRFAGSITRDNPFSFFSDIEDRHTFNVGSKNAMEAFAKDKHSIIGQWGGDLVRHGYQVRLLKKGGSENESLFMYKKNLSSYQHKTSTKSLKTRITFIATVKGEGEKAHDRTFTVTIDSPLINKYSQIYEDVIEVNDQDVKDEASLRKYGEQYYRTSLCDMMEDSLELDVVGQSDVPVQMFDVVSIFHERYNLDVRKKITKYTYSPMAKKLKSIGFGQFQSGLDNAIGNAVSDAVKNEAQQLQGNFEQQLAREIKNADLAFERHKEELVNQFTDDVNAIKAKAEETKRELSDTIDQRFSSFDNGPLQDAKRRAEEALRNAGASELLAQEAKRIGLDSVAKLEEFKRQATSAQSALSWNLDTLKRTVTSEANQASEYRRTTTEALSRMTGQMNGFATKSEVKQDIDGLTETFAKMKVGGTNLLKGSKGPFLPDRKPGNFDNNVLYAGNTSIYMEQGQEYIISAKTDGNFTAHHDGTKESDNVVLWIMDKDTRNYQIVSDLKTGTTGTKFVWNRPTGIYHLRVNTYHKEATKSVWDVKIEKGNVATDWSPAIEDTDGLITEAKATFEQTAQGLRTDLSAIQEYVNKDGQRQEVLQRYAREESAKQATAVRELVAKNYVGKATYQEDVRGIENRFEGITNPQNGSIATQISNYKKSVDGRFADITSLIAGKANQTDFQRVKETSQLYERIIGSNENDISNRVARMAVTNQIFQVEVGKYGGGGPNLVKNSDFKDGMNEWTSKQNLGRLVKHGFYHNSQKDLMRLSNSTQSDIFLNSPRFELERNTDYVLNFRGFNNGALVSYDVFILGRKIGETSDFSIAKKVIDSKKLSTSKCEDVSITFNSGEMDNAYIRFDNNGSLSGTADLYITEVDLYKGYKPRPWQPHPEDIVTDANAKLEATQTKMTQLAGSWAVQNLTSAGALVSGLNLGANGHNRLDGKLTHITGETLIDKAVIKSAMIDKLKTANFEAGSVTTVILDAEAVTAEKLKVDQAFFNKLVANEAYLSQLFAKQAFINRVQSIAIDASQVRSGILSGDRIYGGTIRGAEINGTRITGDSRITIGDNGFLRPTQYGGLQINIPETYNANKGVGVQLFGRKLGEVPKGMFIYNSPSWAGGDGIGESVSDTLLTVKGLTSLCNLFNGKPMSGLPINSNFRFGEPVQGVFRVSFIAWDPRYGQLMVNDGTNTKGTWWFKPDPSSSDKQLKVNIQDTDFEATDFVKKLEFKQFDWKPDKFGYKKPYTNVGLIAQDVEKLDSSLVYSQGENLALDDFRLGNIALKAIQELSQRIETLERKLA